VSADPMRPADPAGPGQQPGGLPAAQGRDGEREDWYAWGPDAEGSDPWDGDPSGRDLRRGADNWDPEDGDPEDCDPDNWDPEDCERTGRDLHLDADDHDPDADGPPVGSVFAQGRWGDELAPDPVLATLLDLTGREGLEHLDDDQLTGMLQAAARLAAWSASLKIAATSRLAGRREADGRRTGDWRPFDHVDDEVAVALTLTRRSAGRLLDLALSLDRLPLTRAALASGQIDERRAEVITEELSGLDDEHAAAVEKLIIAKAPALTTGQLRALARRLVISADPAAARQRKEQALKDARVETFTEHAGTAGLSGRDLCPSDVLAADKYLTALAEAMKAAGITGTMDILRAHAYLHLLSGQPASDLLLLPGTAAPDSSIHSRTTSGRTSPGRTSPGLGSPQGSATVGASPGLRGTVNLTMPLSAWLGWTQSPGDVPGFGPLDAADSRTLAGLLSRNPANQWCVTLTDRAGHPVAHACAPHGPQPQRGISPGPGPPASHGTRASHATRAGPGDRHPAAGPPDSQPTGDGPPVARPSAAGPPDWLRNLTFTTLETQDCAHARESRGYQPSPALRHLIQIRNPTCTAPGCRRASTRCDLDHVTPYDRGGRTCECNLGPACRHDHQCKQTPGWTLTTPTPGTFTWTTPGNRTLTTTPAQYPE
jgi:hypothetical protein